METIEALTKKRNDLEAEVQRLFTRQLTVKILINSIYG